MTQTWRHEDGFEQRENKHEKKNEKNRGAVSEGDKRVSYNVMYSYTLTRTANNHAATFLLPLARASSKKRALSSISHRWGALAFVCFLVGKDKRGLETVWYHYWQGRTSHYLQLLLLISYEENPSLLSWQRQTWSLVSFSEERDQGRRDDAYAMAQMMDGKQRSRV